MSYFEDVYKKRLNRYGTDYKTRMQNMRERDFENQLVKSVYRVDFEYDYDYHPGILTKKSQDNTETAWYLLTRVTTNLPNGTILMLPDKDEEDKPWMVYYLEDMEASGYNRYIMLKMTHYVTWKDREGREQSTWAYMYGQEDNMLKDELKSRSRDHALYTENLKLSFFVMPANQAMRKDDYLKISSGVIEEAYRVTGYDIQSTPGVEFVSLDPIYIYDETPAPVQNAEDKSEDYFWLNGGNQ